MTNKEGIELLANKVSEKIGEREGQAFFEDFGSFIALQHLYNSAIREVRTKLEILNDEFRVRFKRNPIHHVESRLKSPQSIANKLNKRGYEVSLDSAKKNLNDLAGVRVICNYIDDVYAVEEMLLRQSDVKLVDRTDYIEQPNYNGYRSLHIDIETPIYLSDRTENAVIEIQIRTIAMDFWASLEHDIRYKSSVSIPQDINTEMYECAYEIAQIDEKMQKIYKKLQEIE